MKNGLNVYIAGPLFTPAERERNRTLRDLISEFANVFLPQEDGGLIFDLIRQGVPPQEAKLRIFKDDIRAIDHCDVLVILMDGRTVDEGACFELGYAYCLGKTCVGLKTDARSLFVFGDNPMIEAGLRRIFGSESELVEWLKSWQQNA